MHEPAGQLHACQNIRHFRSSQVKGLDNLPHKHTLLCTNCVFAKCLQLLQNDIDKSAAQIFSVVHFDALKMHYHDTKDLALCDAISFSPLLDEPVNAALCCCLTAARCSTLYSGHCKPDAALRCSVA